MALGLVIDTRLSYEVEMDVETLQKYIAAVQNAKENMLEGQVLRVKVSHNVDFIFRNLKPFKANTSISRETVEDTSIPKE